MIKSGGGENPIKKTALGEHRTLTGVVFNTPLWPLFKFKATLMGVY